MSYNSNKSGGGGGGSGTVTSITQGAGITLTPSPIITTGSVALTIPVSIAHGGSNATSFTQSNGVVVYNGTALVNYPGPQISSAGIATNSTQPAFFAFQSTSPSNVTGGGTAYTLALDTTLINQGSYFDTSTFTFTAPSSGLYQFNVAVLLSNALGATTYQLYINFNSGNNTYNGSYTGPNLAGGNFYGINFSAAIIMNPTDTAQFVVAATGGADTIGVDGSQGFTFVSGYLVC